jgi:hypothetical protein
MDPRDDDIDFDFFEDEPATTEAQSSQSRVRLPRRGGRGTGMRGPSGPSRGLTPLLRLLALIALIVAALVFFGLLIQSCASTSKHDAYKSYMSEVAAIAQGSSTDGADLATDLTTPGLKAADLATKLSGIAEQERQNVTKARHLDPPGPLRDEHQHMIEALQLRVNGISGLARTFTTTATSKASSDAELLATQADRLLASDVVWDDLFLEPAKREMDRQNVSGVIVPESHAVANRDLVTERSMSLVLDRLRGASTGGTPTGVHGTNIVATKALPANQALTTGDNENTILATQDLAFEVTVHNGGDAQEVGIKVTMTLQKVGGGNAIVRTTTIPLINPSQDTTVTFKQINVTGLFAQRAELNVDVAPVPGEKDATNNKATYPVIFSLP